MPAATLGEALALLHSRYPRLRSVREDMGALAGRLPEHLRPLRCRGAVRGRSAGRCPRRRASDTGAELTAEEARYTRNLYRSHCEVADQWSFIEMAELLTQARERLFLDHACPPDRLRLAVSAPVRSFSALLRRPMYSFDECVGTTRAFAVPDGAVFVHTLRRLPAASANMTAWELIDAT